MVLEPKPINRNPGPSFPVTDRRGAGCFERDEDGGNVPSRFCGWLVVLF